MRVLKARGTLVKSGVHAPGRWEWSPLYFKEISWVGSNAFGIEEVEGVRRHGIEHYLDLAATGRVDLDRPPHPHLRAVGTGGRPSPPSPTRAAAAPSRSPSTPPADAVTHPLDPLTADEIAAAVAAVRASGRLADPAPPGSRPSPSTTPAPQARDRPRPAGGRPRPGRRGRRGDRRPAVRRGRRLGDARRRPARPRLRGDSVAIVALHEHEGFRAALAARGITDLDKVQIDPWPTGTFGIAAEEGRRVARCICFYRRGARRQRLRPPDRGPAGARRHGPGRGAGGARPGAVPAARRTAAATSPRTTRRGPDLGAARDHPARRASSFTVDGNLLRWQGWSLRVCLDPLEGLVLHDVGYGRRAVDPAAGVDQRDGRPLRRPRPRPRLEERLRRRRVGPRPPGQLAGARLRLPRRDPLPRRGSGRRAGQPVDDRQRHLPPRGGRRHPLEAPGPAHRPHRGAPLAAAGRVVDRHGRQLRVRLLLVLLPGRLPRARGEAHRHPVDRGGRPRRRARPTRGCRRSPPAWPRRSTSTCSAPASTSPSTGRSTRCTRSTSRRCPTGDGNPWGNGFAPVVTRLASERAGPAPRRPGPQPVVGRREPGRAQRGSGGPWPTGSSPGRPRRCWRGRRSSIAARAGFATRNLWVTPYDPDERRAAGDFPNQHPGGDGLPAWTAADRSLVDRDVVVWHTFGVTHVPRPEDWPVMPVETTGFQLAAVGFFDRNPALDVPPPDHCHA